MTKILLLIPSEDGVIQLKGLGHVDATCSWLVRIRNRQFGFRDGDKTYLLMYPMKTTS